MISHLRLGVSRLISRSTPLICHVNASRSIGPMMAQRTDLSFVPHHNFFNSSSGKPANAESPSNPASSNNSQAQDDTSKVEETQGESEIETQLRAELSKAVSEVAALRVKAKESEDKYLLALADMDNLRKRLTKQITDGKLYAIQGFCKDLTEIEDILQLAIASIPKEEITKSNKHLKELYEGVTMTEARLLQVFKSHGLTQLNPVNSKFNPNEHEAVIQKEEPGKESGTVIFVSKLGYKLHDRVIRPAVVGVAT